jgi:hypothetical protein
MGGGRGGPAAPPPPPARVLLSPTPAAARPPPCPSCAILSTAVMCRGAGASPVVTNSSSHGLYHSICVHILVYCIRVSYAAMGRMQLLSSVLTNSSSHGRLLLYTCVRMLHTTRGAPLLPCLDRAESRPLTAIYMSWPLTSIVCVRPLHTALRLRGAPHLSSNVSLAFVPPSHLESLGPHSSRGTSALPPPSPLALAPYESRDHPDSRATSRE